ncbi:hypothetical protein GLOIN_2v1769465 [Rhizophagus clarus]|uniref:Uncharacterized protein n=1 Tax=Rhizophagus clarus TaxID=94130 RepID=A0A8H3LKC6_9GLOM|nr:hypothetical protein GLOIN_2v1769465 [Rhizophagus clarus]
MKKLRKSLDEVQINTLGKSKQRCICIFEKVSNFLEKDEENNAKENISINIKAYELSEELGALIAIAKSEVDESIISNFTKYRNDQNIINFISANLDEIVEQLKKIRRELSIDSYIQPHATSLQRLNFLPKSSVGLDLWKDFGKRVPLSVIYPGIVDGKEYIITAFITKNLLNMAYLPSGDAEYFVNVVKSRAVNINDTDSINWKLILTIYVCYIKDTTRPLYADSSTSSTFSKSTASQSQDTSSQTPNLEGPASYLEPIIKKDEVIKTVLKRLPQWVNH